MFPRSRLHNQIPRQKQSSGFLHLLVPPQGFDQVRDVKPSSPITRDYPRCISRDFRGTRSFQGARGERIRCTQASPQRRVELLCPTESYLCFADGILYGGSKGIGLVDGHSASVECNALWPDAEIRNARVDGTSRDGTQGNPPNCIRNQYQPCCLFLDRLSLSEFEGALGRGNRGSAPTGFRSDDRIHSWGNEDFAGVIGE